MKRLRNFSTGRENFHKKVLVVRIQSSIDAESKPRVRTNSFKIETSVGKRSFRMNFKMIVTTINIEGELQKKPVSFYLRFNDSSFIN